MADFDGTNPDKARTDPRGLHRNPHYPAHLYRLVTAPSPTTLVVSWRDDLPVYNDVAIAEDDKAKAKLLKAGFKEAPIVPKADESAA